MISFITHSHDKDSDQNIDVTTTEEDSEVANAQCFLIKQSVHEGKQVNSIVSKISSKCDKS